MITNVNISSFCSIDSLNWNDLQKINLIIGRNSSGKTTILKALYVAIRTVEQFGRGNNPNSFKSILFDNLYWTFQVDKLGKLVKKGNQELSFSCTSDQNEIMSFSFGETTERNIVNAENNFNLRNINSIFLPAKEILSLQDLILRSRDDLKIFGFDNTYYDLAKALTPSRKGRNYKGFSAARKHLKDAIGGSVVYSENKKIWQFRDKDNRVYDIDITAEGIKKLGILDSLLGNHYLSKDSIIFIDEPECALHPELISSFMEIILSLAKVDGIQIFIATHSYFVIKKLYLLARENKMSIPIISNDNNVWEQYDLLNGMPDNPIIDESIRLYKKEIML